jgi:hypothetical protein
MKTAPKTVAIAFDLNFRHAAEIFSGVSDYVAEAHLDWQLMPLNFGFEARLMDLARSGQLSGALGTFVSDRWVEGLLETGVPAINMFHFSKIEAAPTVGLTISPPAGQPPSTCARKTLGSSPSSARTASTTPACVKRDSKKGWKASTTLSYDRDRTSPSSSTH